LTEIEPAQESDEEESGWPNSQGEAPDHSAMTALHLAHRVVNKFPELTKRYQKFIGMTAVVSSALIVLASIAVARRLNRGESAEHILASITPDEIENAGKEKPSKPTNNGHNGDKGRFFH